VCAVLCCAVLSVLCCAVLCCAVLCCAVLCCAVLCCAVLCTSAAVIYLSNEACVSNPQHPQQLPTPTRSLAQAPLSLQTTCLHPATLNMGGASCSMALLLVMMEMIFDCLCLPFCPASHRSTAVCKHCLQLADTHRTHWKQHPFKCSIQHYFVQH